MLSWASKQLERLSETIAPPPSTPAHRFQTAITASNYPLAIALLSPSPPPLEDGTPGYQLDPHGSVLNVTRGSLPIHFAAQHGATEVVYCLIQQHGVQPHIFDIQGNTPLHYASSSYHPDAINLVRSLVTQYDADVTMKNAMGQTPYDVSIKDPIRQFLLPIQLQKETQQCLDNGGQGLPQGIDLGGLACSPRAGLAPPPIMSMGANNYNNNTNVNAHATTPTASHHQNWNNAAGESPSYHANNSALVNVNAQAQAQAQTQGEINKSTENNQYAVETTQENNSNPTSIPETTPATTQPPQPQTQPQPQPQPVHPTPQNANNNYARSGSSSAALLNKYRADGFNSSDNDVSLQAKYGHDQGSKTTFSPPPALAPPAATTMDAKGPAAPNEIPNPSGAGGGYNPYAGGYNAARIGRNRYPTYDPISNKVGHTGYANANQHNYDSTGNMNATTSMASTPQYTVFTPSGVTSVTGQQQQQQQPGYYPNQINQQATYHGPNHYPHQQPTTQPNTQFSTDSSSCGYQGHHQQEQQSNPSFAQPPAVDLQTSHHLAYPDTTSHTTVAHQEQNYHHNQLPQQEAPPQQQNSTYQVSTSTHSSNQDTRSATMVPAVVPFSTHSVQHPQQQEHAHSQQYATTKTTDPAVQYSHPAAKPLSISHAEVMSSSQPATQECSAGNNSYNEYTESVPSNGVEFHSTLVTSVEEDNSSNGVEKDTTSEEVIEKAPVSASVLFGQPSQHQPLTTTTAVHANIAQPPSSATELFGLSSLSLTSGKYDLPSVPGVTNLNAPPSIIDPSLNGTNAVFSATTTDFPSSAFSGSSSPMKTNVIPSWKEGQVEEVASPPESFLPPPPILSDITHTAVKNNTIDPAADAGLGNGDLPPPPMMDVSF